MEKRNSEQLARNKKKQNSIAKPLSNSPKVAVRQSPSRTKKAQAEEVRQRRREMVQMGLLWPKKRDNKAATVEVSSTVKPRVCQYFVHAQCVRRDCPFLHEKLEGQIAEHAPRQSAKDALASLTSTRAQLADPAIEGLRRDRLCRYFWASGTCPLARCRFLHIDRNAVSDTSRLGEMVPPEKKKTPKSPDAKKPEAKVDNLEKIRKDKKQRGYAAIEGDMEVEDQAKLANARKGAKLRAFQNDDFEQEDQGSDAFDEEIDDEEIDSDEIDSDEIGSNDSEINSDDINIGDLSSEEVEGDSESEESDFDDSDGYNGKGYSGSNEAESEESSSELEQFHRPEKRRGSEERKQTVIETQKKRKF